MSKRSRSCSDLRGVSIIKSTRQKTPKRDSSTQLSFWKPECICVQNSPYKRLSSLDDFDIGDIDVSSYDIERQIKKNETLSKLIHSLIIEKQSREKRLSCMKKSQRYSPEFFSGAGANTTQKPSSILSSATKKFSSDHSSTTKKRSTDQSSISSSISSGKKDKPRLSNITQHDIENMRDIIRMENGLPTTNERKKKSIDLRKLPKIIPKPTKLSQSRYNCARASYPKLRSLSCRDDSSCNAKSIEDYDKSPQEIWEEEDLRRLKYLAESHKTSDPSYKFNRVFHLRYQHNKGTPEIPDSFRQSYARFNKPLFQMVNKLDLPRKYLMPKFGENEISLFGLPSDVSHRIVDRGNEKECIQTRKRIGKRGRVVRIKKDKPSKKPWSYGRVNFCSPASK